MQQELREAMEVVVTEVHIPQRGTDSPSTRRSAGAATAALTRQLVVRDFEKLEAQVLCPQVQGREGGESVVGEVQRLQHWELEQLAGHRWNHIV